VSVEGVSAFQGETTAAGTASSKTLRAAVRDGRLTLSVGGGTSGVTAIAYVDVVAAPLYAAVNYQPALSPVPTGYVPDFGQAYTAVRGYGWADDSLVTWTRDRNLVADQALDTIICTAPDEEKTWWFDLPNGDYQATVSVGDPAWVVTPQRVIINGQPAIEHIGTAAGSFATGTACVSVADGKITLKMGGDIGWTCMNWFKLSSTRCGPD
jgi:hypothetical protein